MYKSVFKIKLLIVPITLLSLCLYTGGAIAQRQTKLSTKYLHRAEKMYADIWDHYRVKAYPGLFSENYPVNEKDTVDYLQGDKVKAREVSFLWPFSGMFSATNVLLKNPLVREKYLPYMDTMVMGMEQYLDTVRKPTAYSAYPPQFSKDDRFYDDNGLVGIEYMEAYLSTKKPFYLSRAKVVFKFILSGWSKELGGGVYWLEGHNDQKPACSNGMDMLVALKLYQATKDSYYLSWGKRFYDWMETNLRNPDGVYYNDKKTADGSVNRTLWSYNSGSMLQGSVLLYQFTHEKKYLTEGEMIAKNSYLHFSSEQHDIHLNMRIDQAWFMTVLFKGYEELYKIDDNYTYIAAFSKDLNYAWENTKDKYGFLTKNWTNNQNEVEKPKWLLDEACIAELYARLSLLESERKN